MKTLTSIKNFDFTKQTTVALQVYISYFEECVVLED